MIIECLECGEKNQTIQPPQPAKNYRCRKCGAAITILQTVDTTTETTDPSVTGGTDNITGGKTVIKKMSRSKEYMTSGLLIVLSLVINFVDYFYVNQNPYPSLPTPYQRLWAIGGSKVAIAAIIAVFFIIPKEHKHSYLYYFAVLSAVISVFSIVLSLFNLVL